MRLKHLRYILLSGILIFLTLIAIFHQKDEIRFPPVDSLCPFGTLESLYSLIFQGKFIHRVFSSSLILLLISIVLVIFSGKSFCGYICPFGALQGIVGHISRMFKRNDKPVTILKDRWFRLLKYPVLIIFTVGAWVGGKLLIRPYDPWVAWMHLSEFSHSWTEFPVGFILLFGIIVLSFFISRVFCRYLCPMGAFLGLLNKISPFQVHRDISKCNDCSLCNKACPVGIDVSKSVIMNKEECISCGECINICTQKKALTFGFKKNSLFSGISISNRSVLIIVLVVFFGGIGFTKAIGVYRSTNYSIDELKNKKNLVPEDIKGYMSLKEVADVFKLNLSDLYQVLGLDYSIVPADIKCKEIADIIGRQFETDVVRIGVGKLLNIPEENIQKSCSPSGENQGSFFIPGTMTLEEVAKVYMIPPEELYKELGIKESQAPLSTQCRDLRMLINPAFHTTKVREVVARILERRR